MAERDLGWWTIHGNELMEMMHRAAAGEDPDLIYAEVYANSEHHDYGKEEK